MNSSFLFILFSSGLINTSAVLSANVVLLLLQQVVNLCVNPDPAHRPDTSKLLTLSFLKVLALMFCI